MDQLSAALITSAHINKHYSCYPRFPNTTHGGFDWLYPLLAPPLTAILFMARLKVKGIVLGHSFGGSPGLCTGQSWRWSYREGHLRLGYAGALMAEAGGGISITPHPCLYSPYKEALCEGLAILPPIRSEQVEDQGGDVIERPIKGVQFLPPL